MNMDYKYGFIDEDNSKIKFDKGLSEKKIRDISEIKNEPEWMLTNRIKAYKKFLELNLPNWNKFEELNINLDDIHYYIKPDATITDSWDNVPDSIKNTFDKLGIPEAEDKYLSGVATQYESEMVYHNIKKELDDLGIIFLDTDTALRKHPDLFKEYFGALVPYTDNKFAALNSAVWSGGSFIYIPKGVKLDKPLQSYFRMNSNSFGQFERTLIIVDEGASLHYIEGCTAPTYSDDSLHASVVEIFVKKDAYCRYTAIQNWSNNVYNLVTKRAIVDESATMEWIDGNLGSKYNMKYPSIILRGENSKGTTISIAVANNQIQDAGAKMIHLAPNTSSKIISKAISKNGGINNYRGYVVHNKDAYNAKTEVECDTLLLDNISISNTIPYSKIENNTSSFIHEAKVSKIDENKLFYMMSRGISEEDANNMLILGFIDPFTKELPMEYAIELNELLKMSMEGSIG